MKKKSILALLVALVIIVSMPISAMAANVDDNVNQPTDEVTAPGNKGPNGYDKDNGGSTQQSGESYGEATVEGSDGTNWSVTNDDSIVDKTTEGDHKTDINVWARITDASAKIYKIDIEWGSMKFEYSDGSGAWNTSTHSYDGAVGGIPHWINSFDGDQIGSITEQTGYEVGTNGKNNRVSVTNHSNSAVDAAFDYQMVGSARSAGTAATMFNDGGTDISGDYGADYGADVDNGYDAHANHDVIGYFYSSNTEAAKAHVAIANTYDSGAADTAVSNWKYDDGDDYVALVNAPTLLDRLSTVDSTKVTAATTPAITLPTAEAIGAGTALATAWSDGTKDAESLVADLTAWNTTEWANGARKANVYFAFSGQPDKGQGAILATFTKVGVITVTITPNDTADYNRGAAAASNLPSAPQNVSAAAEDQGVTLFWDAPSSNGGSAITGYKVSKDGANWDDVGNVLTYTYSGLTNGVQYTFKILAYNANGDGNEITMTATPNS